MIDQQMPQSSPWLSIEELADRLGLPVSSVWKLRSQRKGPRGVRMGKRLRFHLEDVLAWEQERRNASV